MVSKNSNYKIALYVRVSSEEQAENPEGSIKSQEQRLREAIHYKNRNGAYGEIVDVYIDAGISAKNMNRPKLQELLLDIKMKRVNLIMMTELSRLSRNMRDFIQIWDILKENNCSFMSLREDFDTTNSAGEMLLLSIMNFNQFERRQTSERVKANLLARSKRGLYNGGAVPLGYKSNPDRPGYLDIDDETAFTVKLAFQKYLELQTLSHTAKWLNDNGYKPNVARVGGGSKMRVGHFTVDNLWHLLKNKMYMGVKTYYVKEEEFETKAVWDAIIDELTFKKVNDQLVKNKSKLKVIKENKYPYILSGVCFCMTCGDFMSGKSATGRNGKVPYYEHSWATKRDSCLTKKTFKCSPHRVQAKIIEPLVWSEFQKLLNSEEFMKGLLSKVKEKFQDDDESKERDRLKAKSYGLNSQLEALAERIAILPKELSPIPLFNQMEKIQKAKEEVDKKLFGLKDVNLDERLVNLTTIKKFIDYSKFLLNENPDFNIRRKVLQKFVRRVEIGVNSVKIYWNVDKAFYLNELTIKSNTEKSLADAGDPLLKLKKNVRNVGSNSFTNGAQDWT